MILGIPVYDGVDVLDVTGPYELLNWAGFDVRVAAEKPGAIRCRGKGMSIVAHHGFDDTQYDVLWVPGGEPDALASLIHGKNQTYMDFIKRQAAKATYVCSVCEGAVLLAAAGLLTGYTVTTHWQFTPCLAQYPNVTVAQGHPRYVWDRNRLTGGGISSGLDESLALIERVFGTAAAQDVQRTTQYYPNPPVTSEMLPAPTECYVPSSAPKDCC